MFSKNQTKIASISPTILFAFVYFCVMQAPKLPSFFKTAKHRRFDFKTRYYDERKKKFR